MTASPRRLSARVLGPTSALLVSSLLFGSICLADQAYTEGKSYGDVHEGKMTLPLRWSAALSPETLSVAVPGNCEGTINLTMTWDEEEDWLKIRLQGENVLTPHPVIHRTPGVDFFPNPFWPEAEDILGGRYQLWFISPSEEINYYYDQATLDLVGSEHDLGAPPAGTFPIHIPGIKVLGSEFFQPDDDGDLDVEFTWSYSGLVRLDRPEFSHMFVSFPPPNLCGSNPYRYDLSTNRGHISAPRPASEARPFDAYFRNGIIFQITVEPPQYFVDPPRDTQTAAYSNVTNFGGLVPPGYTFDFDAVFSNVAPGIKPLPMAGQCVNHFSGVHTKNLNFCGP